MVGLAIRFPAGRYHATPWGAHVNEAAIEWPPSPWRLLRALVSSWHRAAPELPEADVLSVLNALATPPRYWLPPSSPAHTRHYMPDRGHRRELDLKQNLVFDAFLAVNPDTPIVVLWPADLTDRQEVVLRHLAAGVTYLGRSESWCDVGVVRESASGMEVAPVEVAGVQGDYEVVRLLTPTRPLELATLEVSTGDLQAGRRRLKDPPGTTFVRYARPLHWAHHRRQRLTRRTSGPRVQAVVWALDGRPLPLLTQVEEVARKVREGIRLRETPQTGRLRVLPYASSSETRPACVDRVALWAERGLHQGELERACGLGPFVVPGMSAAQVPLLLGYGRPSELAPPVFGPGRVWRSHTPLLPTVEVRAFRGREPDAQPGPADLVAAAIPTRCGMPSAIGPAESAVRWLEFRRGMALGARVEFPEPIEGPLVAERQPPGFGLFLCVS